MLYHEGGRGVNASGAHLVVTLSLLESASGTKGNSAPRSVGVCRFAEIGDGASDAHTHALAGHSHHGGGSGGHHGGSSGYNLSGDELAKMDRLHGMALGDRSFRGLAHVAEALDKAFDAVREKKNPYFCCHTGSIKIFFSHSCFKKLLNAFR